MAVASMLLSFGGDKDLSRLLPFLTDFEAPLCCPSMDLDQFLIPLDDVALQVTGAVGQAQDLRWHQDVIPHVELSNFTNEGLSCVKTPTQCILQALYWGGGGEEA